MRLRWHPLLLVFVVLATACDRTPSDPSDSATELAAYLLEQSVGGAGDARYSLPALLQTAIQRVYSEQGAQAARTLVRDLRRAQENARATSGIAIGETVTAQRRAIEAAQIQIVLRVYGEEIVSAVIAAVRADAQRSRAELEAMGARAPERARRLLAEVDEQLFDAGSALGNNAAQAALELATHAGTAAADARAVILEATRVPTLDRLFESVRTTLEVMPTEGRREMLRAHDSLQLTARVAVTGGDREAAQKALDAVRASEIRIVLRTLGDDVVSGLLSEADGALQRTAEMLAREEKGERSVVRLSRMHASARDLLVRAHAAERRGDHAAALDLGSHAAGLLNSIRAAL